jgi:hypothetical protein
LSLDLLQRLDLEDSAGLEMQQGATYLPSVTAELAIRSLGSDYADRLRARLTSGLALARREFVWVPKAQVGRYRPVLSLSFSDRVLLRSLIADVTLELEKPSGPSTFETDILINDEVRYVVMTDVSSFYFYIDHALLEARAIEVSGRTDSPEALSNILDLLFEAPTGIPQDFEPSRLLGDLILESVERALIRNGFEVSRQLDDFRIGTRTWGEALQAVELFHDETRRLGLTTNEEKTRIMRRERYEENLGFLDRFLIEVFKEAADLPEDLAVPFIVVDPYTAEPEEPEETTEQVSRAEMTAFTEAAFEKAARMRLSSTTRTPRELAALRGVLTGTLAYFIHEDVFSAGAVALAPRLLAVDPLLTRQYAAYFRTTAIDGDIDLNAVVSKTKRRFRQHMPAWVTGWLHEPLLLPEKKLSRTTLQWSRDFMRSSAPSVLRGRAAIGLAAHGATTVEQLLDEWESLTDAATPDFAFALALAADTGEMTRRARAAIGRDDIGAAAFALGQDMENLMRV